MARRARQDHSGEQSRDARADRAREVGLFRYALIRTAADPALSTRQRGRLVRDLAAREHTGPFGQRVRISRVWKVGAVKHGRNTASRPASEHGAVGPGGIDGSLSRGR